MKCFACDGTGMCHDEEMRFDCPVCHGTGEYFPTNEEWLRSCSTEELAEQISNFTVWGYNGETLSTKEAMEWLRRKHTT